MSDRVNKWLQIMQSINWRGVCKYQAVKSKWKPLVCSHRSLGIPQTKTTCWSSVSSYSINNSSDGTCHKEAANKVTELTGVLCNLLPGLSPFSIWHINSHNVRGTQVCSVSTAGIKSSATYHMYSLTLHNRPLFHRRQHFCGKMIVIRTSYRHI